MLKDLPTINQSGIKELIRERLENPAAYAGRPLIIWRSDFRDGIQERILEEVFTEYNKLKSVNDRLWFRATSLCPGYQLKYDFTTPEVLRTDLRLPKSEYGKYKLGLFVIETWLVSKQSDMDELYSAINTRTLNGVTMLEGVPVVAFMCHNFEGFETPEKYPLAEQYVFDPDFEEWVEWATKEKRFPKQIIDFIRGDGKREEIIYRWYNYFSYEHDYPTKRIGCNYPRIWSGANNRWRKAIRKAAVKDISELSEKQLKAALLYNCSISDDVKDAFYKFVSENKGQK